ncbi:hypothetical protein TNCV_334521 [Trichonephila clavipes]|nr:hypothetical protein TNCV_334521 [Trichonephila clavipes]
MSLPQIGWISACWSVEGVLFPLYHPIDIPMEAFPDPEAGDVLSRVANLKLKEKSIPVKHQLCNISGDRLITETAARLRTCHYRGMKFDRDDKRTYRN